MNPERVPKAPSVSVTLNRTHLSILEACWQFRYLRLQDLLVHLELKSAAHLRGLCAALCGGRDLAPYQYLLRAPMPRTRGGVGKFYCLGSRGVALIARELGLSARAYRPNKLAGLSVSHVTHALLLSRTVIALQRFVRRQSAFRLLDARLSYQFQLVGEPALGSVIPDAWILLEKDGKKYPLWIEIDNSSQWFKKWTQALKARIEFINSGAYARAFPEASGAVLIAYAVAAPTVDAAARRCDQLRTWTMRTLHELEMEQWASILRFSALPEDLYSASLCEAPWQRPDDGKAEPLLAP